MDRRIELMRDDDRPNGWLLAVDDVAQSYVDTGDPMHLEFHYVRLLADVADLLAPPGQPLSALHLGGGACTLARYVAATRPGSDQVVVEHDPGLAALVLDELGTPGFTLAVADARAELDRLPSGSRDLVVLDAFDGPAVPPHLTTIEHLDGVRRVLATSGVYAANIADADDLSFARGQVATLRERFDAVALLAPPAVLRGRRFGNLILVASDAELPISDLARRAAGRAEEPARLLTGTELAAWCADAPVVTDATAAASPAPPPGVFTLSRPGVAQRRK